MTTTEDSKKRETPEQASARIEDKYLARAVTPLKAVRAKCVQCQGGMVKQIAQCPSTTCALHPFRMGTNPNGKHKPGAKTKKV